MESAVSYYPKISASGGHLIRSVLALFKSFGLAYPINSHILISVSAGSDSIALAHLFCRYGRKISPKAHLQLVHFDHGWRAESEALADFKHLQYLAEQVWQVPLEWVRLPSPEVGDGESWEAHSRNARYQVLDSMRERLGQKALIVTAHHREDLAETVLWRLVTGAPEQQQGGIYFYADGRLRPFLNVSKALLQDFLREEGIAWREDSTNDDVRFLRNRMRQELMPVLHALFPTAGENLAQFGLRRQLQKTHSKNNLLPECGISPELHAY